MRVEPRFLGPGFLLICSREEAEAIRLALESDAAAAEDRGTNPELVTRARELAELLELAGVGE